MEALFAGHAEHTDACAALNEPAGQLVQVRPSALTEPAKHGVQAGGTLALALLPGEQTQVLAPAALVLYWGQAEHDDAPAKLYELAEQIEHANEAPLPLPA